MLVGDNDKTSHHNSAPEDICKFTAIVFSSHCSFVASFPPFIRVPLESGLSLERDSGQSGIPHLMGLHRLATWLIRFDCLLTARNANGVNSERGHGFLDPLQT